MKILFLLSRFLDGGIDTVAVEHLNAMCRYTEHKVKTSYLIHEDWLTAYKRGKRQR